MSDSADLFVSPDDPDEGIEPDESPVHNGGQLERIADPFDPLQIKISRRVVTVEQVVKRIQFGEIELAPDFQRRARIWDIVRKSRLIESLLLRIPLPVFYVASDVRENWRVVDGLQRLTTIADFIDRDSAFQYKLKGLEYLSEYEGLGYDDLPRGIIRRIDETELNINIIESGTPDQVMFNIFKRLNTGGMSLNNQEIRHALNPGPARGFLTSLVETSEFQAATNGSVKDHRMGARELVLRFVAFYLTSYRNYAADDLDGFLSEAMRRLNKMSSSELDGIRAAFRLAMRRAVMIFGDDAFRKRYDRFDTRKPINRALFEAWSLALVSLSDEEFSLTYARRENLVDRFIDLLNDDEEFGASISVATGNRHRVYERFSAVENIIGETLLANAD